MTNNFELHNNHKVRYQRCEQKLQKQIENIESEEFLTYINQKLTIISL